MTNYTYIINVQNNYGYICESETTNWQEAIDLFQHGKTMGKTCFMLTCQIVVKDESTNALNYLTDMQDIQWWSEHLINLRYNEESEADEEEEVFKNRILGRIAQEADGMEVVTPDFHGDFSDMEGALQEAIINPKHYKLFSKEDYSAYPNGIEYMDLCDKALAHLTGVEAHLVGQILKYTLRVGKKDAMEQDAKKIEWYATRLVNTIKGG
jgi:hypothetical protein